MKVLVCGMNYAPDMIGVAKYNSELCESLAAGGHEVRVVTAPPYYPSWELAADYRSIRYRREHLKGVRVLRSPIYVPSRPSGGARILHHASFSLSSAGPILSQALSWRPDVVFAVAPSLLSVPLAAMAAKLARATSWLHVQDLEIDAAFELGLLTNRRARSAMLSFERLVLRAFDRVSTISSQMMKRLEAKGLAPEKLREVRNWVDTTAVVPGSRETDFRSELGLTPDHIVVLYSGAMAHKQGLDLIVRAAAKMRDGHPNIRFVLCGSGPYKRELVRLAEGLSNMQFLDLQPAERLPELLNTADMHVLPQKAEAADLVLPSKLSGMLASGRPVVVMAQPGTGIAMEADGAGLVIPPNDAAALAGAITLLAANAEMRARFGAAARRRAELKWDRHTIVRSLEREFLEARRDGRLSRERTVPAAST